MQNDIFRESINTWHQRRHYDYQLRIADPILDGMRAAQAGETIEIPIELPRQSGKTTVVVDAVEYILMSFRRAYGFPVASGIFAPQREQATTDFDRLKTQFRDLAPLGITTRIKTKKEIEMPGKWNSQTVRLFKSDHTYLGETYIFPISKTSHPESKTLHLIIIEEAQDVIDRIMQDAVFPMGAATNALRILVGTAGTRLCHFKNELDTNPRAVKVKLDEVFKDRRKMYELTGDAQHLQYERYVGSEIQKYGKDDPYIRTQYLGEWIIGAGQFCTVEQLDALIGKHTYIKENRADKKGNTLSCYVGIDTAKHPDRTWVTVLRDHPVLGERYSQLCGWYVLAGENYENQFNLIKDWLRDFDGIKRVAIDSTGQGDFMPDMFENHTSYNLERVKFTLEKKDLIYKTLLQVIHNKLTQLPNEPMSKDFRDHRNEMVNLEREYKGRFMSVHHTDDSKAHDDAPDSWALAEHAKSIALQNAPRLTVM